MTALGIETEGEKPQASSAEHESPAAPAATPNPPSHRPTGDVEERARGIGLRSLIVKAARQVGCEGWQGEDITDLIEPAIEAALRQARAEVAREMADEFARLRRQRELDIERSVAAAGVSGKARCLGAAAAYREAERLARALSGPLGGGEERGAPAAPSGSHASHSAASQLRPAGFDPSRDYSMAPQVEAVARHLAETHVGADAIAEGYDWDKTERAFQQSFRIQAKRILDVAALAGAAAAAGETRRGSTEGEHATAKPERPETSP